MDIRSFRALTKSTRLLSHKEFSGLCKGCREPLSQHASRVFIERAGLRKGINRLYDLRIIFEFDLVPCGQAEYGDERLFLDLPLDPIPIGGNIRLGIADILLVQIAAEGRENAVVHLEISADLRFAAEKIGGEIADASLEGKENVVAKQTLLKVIGLGWGDRNVRADAAASVHLSAAVGQFHFGRLRVLVIV